jgi:hypothetical protein
VTRWIAKPRKVEAHPTLWSVAIFGVGWRSLDSQWSFHKAEVTKAEVVVIPPVAASAGAQTPALDQGN